MKINLPDGTMNLDDDAKPSPADMTDMISSLTNETNFQTLCDASVKFPSETNAQFYAACVEWLKV